MLQPSASSSLQLCTNTISTTVLEGPLPSVRVILLANAHAACCNSLEARNCHAGCTTAVPAAMVQTLRSNASSTKHPPAKREYPTTTPSRRAPSAEQVLLTTQPIPCDDSVLQSRIFLQVVPRSNCAAAQHVHSCCDRRKTPSITSLTCYHGTDPPSCTSPLSIPPLKPLSLHAPLQLTSLPKLPISLAHCVQSFTQSRPFCSPYLSLLSIGTFAIHPMLGGVPHLVFSIHSSARSQQLPHYLLMPLLCRPVQGSHSSLQQQPHKAGGQCAMFQGAT
jgi:hypothetical protein